MTRYRLTRQAVADLDDIWDYTNAAWGPGQADAYSADLFACFARAVVAPNTGQDRSHFVPGARSLTVGRHLVFYRQVKTVVVILRIVHERRNWAALRFADEME
ncbi:type II toxin-antitoxin system RelE/ParE family toxin [Maritimibacter sp. 55A14]|uniref:type II toxin-antitoxin system RelE/ParE family toxin n=1 Tax=Maritimibacter sp. 55A14 TaxID=2174844 RepID=UPI000D615904|nr:type II toxin-antitoxin system RelE/ParE family toxin [Maritimibacter sp. 55A14]PWE32389.1 type II toxin-antitoxin system RelE/ParE family toxin [Maritimibacter sp. 55A14]